MTTAPSSTGPSTTARVATAATTTATTSTSTTPRCCRHLTRRSPSWWAAARRRRSAGAALLGDVAEFLAAYVPAGCGSFNLIPCATGTDAAVDAVARVKALLLAKTLA